MCDENEKKIRRNKQRKQCACNNNYSQDVQGRTQEFGFTKEEKVHTSDIANHKLMQYIKVVFSNLLNSYDNTMANYIATYIIVCRLYMLYCTYNHRSYRIAGYFRGGKFSRISRIGLDSRIFSP